MTRARSVVMYTKTGRRRQERNGWR